MADPPLRILGDGAAYVGKRLLVGITYESHDGQFIRQEQFHGTIVSAHEKGIVLRRADTAEEVDLPPELKEAPPGTYRLRSTGEAVIDPDYLAAWAVKAPPPPEE